MRGGIIYAGASDNRIGGTTSGAANTIAYNSNAGVLLTSFQFDMLANTIVGNSIHDNAIGIDLNNGPQLFDGVTPNDLGDSDTGSNGLQNYPVLTNVINSAVGATIQGTLNSTPNTTFRVEFFANSHVFANGYSEGERFLGYTSVTTDANGNASFSVPLATGSLAGKYVTATATDAASNTSEFSLAYQAPANTPPTAKAGGPYLVVRGGAVRLDASGSTDPDQSSSTLTYAWDFDGDIR